jgi:hypothetical protein
MPVCGGQTLRRLFQPELAKLEAVAVDLDNWRSSKAERPRQTPRAVVAPPKVAMFLVDDSIVSIGEEHRVLMLTAYRRSRKHNGVSGDLHGRRLSMTASRGHLYLRLPPPDTSSPRPPTRLDFESFEVAVPRLAFDALTRGR